MEAAGAGVDLGRYRRIVQMFWDPEPTNDKTSDQPVWCLGNSYRLGRRGANGVPDPSNGLADETESPASSAAHAAASDIEALQDGGWPSEFLDDFESRIWMTYRSEFQPIPKSTDPRAASALSLSMRVKSQFSENGFSSDSGWGCMIRSGQSLLANSLALLSFGRDWRRGQSSQNEADILSKFADDPRAPYSIHQFVHHGAEACGKYPGEWFGPSATAQCIQALANKTEQQLRVYSTANGPDVYQDKFMSIAKPDEGAFHPTLLLVGTRLGIDKVTPIYWEALIAALQMPQSVGIAGGRPASSHYFIGAQGQFLFYLDPHHTRPALPFHDDTSKYTEAEVDSAHTRRLRRLHIREMDPSMLIGFLIRDEDDWEDWKRNVKHVQGKAVIHVSDQDPIALEEGRERPSAIDEVETLSDDDGPA